MLFEEIVLDNFGIYKGRHVIDLRPKSPTKPIILFGALNGSGKTTLLDALQLVLYGKFAKCSNRSSLSYPEYLTSSINSHALPSGGAALELQFTHFSNGTEQALRIIRTWRSTGKGVKEELEVTRDGEVDPTITERWYEFVEKFIPSQISNLFFFDGEKIEALADPERSSSMIRTGISELLGLDLIEQLDMDLKVLDTRRQRKLATDPEQDAISALENEIQTLEAERRQIGERIAESQTFLDQLERIEAGIRAEFRSQGGELIGQREALEAERNATKQRLDDAEEALREIAAGAAPLLTVRDLIRETESQAILEHRAEQYGDVRKNLVQRDSALLSHLELTGTSESILGIIRDFHSADIADRDRHLNFKPYLGINPRAFSSLSDETLNQLTKALSNQLLLSEKINARLNELDENISSIPDPDALSGITGRLDETIKRVEETRIRKAASQSEHEKLNQRLDVLNNKLQSLLDKRNDDAVLGEKLRRMVEHSALARSTLGMFKRRVAEKHLGKLEQLISESFKQLLRKQALFHRVSICPDSYLLRIIKDDGEEIPPGRLSAGERQLLAVSILWGLAKASGRPLPTIIDTPLGRLDGTHRKNLVEAYFPFASHQVILLSTDEEIDAEHLGSLKPSLSMEYLISYDPDGQTSRVNPGYFWDKST